MSIEQNKELVRRWVEEGFNAGNLEVLDEIIADDLINHADRPQGRAGFRETMARMAEAIPDQRMTIEQIVADDEKVAVRTIWIGTPTSPFWGRTLPEGRSFAVTHTHFFRVADGKLAEHWGSRDDLGMYQQLGLFES